MTPAGGMTSRASRTGGTKAQPDAVGGTTSRGRRAVAAAGPAAGGGGGRDHGAAEDDDVGLVTPTEPVPLDQLGRVHFTGIGGAGMSGIARIMLARGTAVSGTDAAPSALLDELAAAGAQVHVGHDAAHLAGADTLVVSTAIRPDNPELAAAQRQGLRILHRAAALASIMLGRRTVAVAGTHGKTTTTSMLTTVLRECGADPAYVIGGILAETGRGADEAAATCSWPKPTRATARSSCSPRRRPSSPAWKRTTWTTTRAWPRSRPRSRRSPSGSAAAGCWWPVPTTRAHGPWPTPPVSCRSVCAPTAKPPTPTTGSAASRRAA